MSPARFKEIRENLGLNQTELAHILGLKNRIAVTHYESGFRNPSQLITVLMEIFNEWPEKKSLELRLEILNRMPRDDRKKRKPSRRSNL